MSEWISVEDSLPNKTGIYRIKGVSGSICRETFEEDSKWFQRSNGTGYFGSCFDWKRATHWMPLPESKKE